jgi:hypothetical protein
VTGDEVFHVASPWISRALVSATGQAGRPGGLCRDDRGHDYSPGALVRIRGEQAAVAVCANGVWIEQNAQSEGAPLWVSIQQRADPAIRAGLQALREPYSGGPWAQVPVGPLRDGVVQTAPNIRIRSWLEDGRARVIVLAVFGRGDVRTETQIATFLLSLGESHEVTETERVGGAHVVVTVTAAGQ